MKGIIKLYKEREGYGFIDGEDGISRFFHITNIKSVEQPAQGSEVEFVSAIGKKGMTATEIYVQMKKDRPIFIQFGEERIKLSLITNYDIRVEEVKKDIPNPNYTSPELGAFVSFGNVKINAHDIKEVKLSSGTYYFQKFYKPIITKHLVDAKKKKYNSVLEYIYNNQVIGIDIRAASHIESGEAYRIIRRKEQRSSYDDFDREIGTYQLDVYCDDSEKARKDDLIIKESGLFIETYKGSYVFFSDGTYISGIDWDEYDNSKICAGELKRYYSHARNEKSDPFLYCATNKIFDIQEKYSELENLLKKSVVEIVKRKYLNVDTYQRNKSYEFYEDEVDFDIYEKRNELDSLKN